MNILSGELRVGEPREQAVKNKATWEMQTRHAQRLWNSIVIILVWKSEPVARKSDFYSSVSYVAKCENKTVTSHHSNGNHSARSIYKQHAQGLQTKCPLTKVRFKWNIRVIFNKSRYLNRDKSPHILTYQNSIKSRSALSFSLFPESFQNWVDILKSFIYFGAIFST